MQSINTISIDTNTVNPGEDKEIFLLAGTCVDGQPLHLRARIQCGKRPGPCVLITGCIHGDEINGPEIIRRLLKEKSLGNLAGVLITIPIVNTPAFTTRSRYMPDRRDLNRLFPGASAGSLGARLAKTLTQHILPQVDLVIDLHTGAANRANLPQLRVTHGDSRAEELAKIFSPPVLLTSSIREGSFRSSCYDLGIPVLLYESGEALRLDAPSIHFAIKGIKSVMRSIGMLSNKTKLKAPSNPVICLKSVWERAPMGGLFTPLVSLGKTVLAGEALGFIADPYSGSEQIIAASHDGILIGRTNEGLADEGDALVHIGFPKKYASPGDRAGFFPDLPDEENNPTIHYDPFLGPLGI